MDANWKALLTKEIRLSMYSKLGRFAMGSLGQCVANRVRVSPSHRTMSSKNRRRRESGEMGGGRTILASPNNVTSVKDKVERKIPSPLRSAVATCDLRPRECDCVRPSWLDRDASAKGSGCYHI